MTAQQRTPDAERAQRRKALRTRTSKPRQFPPPVVRDETSQADASPAEIARACRAIVTSSGYEADIAFALALQYWPPDDEA